ncbi:MAG: hypothetical protein BWX78_00151 [Firmicutes bacterium ADurb.Bin099]|nr:MAG: hypothetical protein BWX78_00151 [Firmicutes bacterium ADurb.Bin099]
MFKQRPQNQKDESKVFEDLLSASESSMDFWFNDVDDEQWNDEKND